MLDRIRLNRSFQVHTLIWLCYTIYYGLLILYFNNILFTSDFIIGFLLLRIGDILFFYCVALWVLPKFFSVKYLYILLIVILGVVASYIGYRYFIEVYVLVYLKIQSAKDINLGKLISLGVFNASNFLIFALGYYFAQRTIQQQKDIAERDVEIANQKTDIAKKELELAEEREKNAILAKEKAQAEMAFLRSQINPHFMFNTLNMIYSKVRAASKEAGDIVIEFADMMRYATSTKLQENEVDLRGELDFVKQYLSLHKQRNQQNAHIDYDEEGYFSSHRVVPMVLITLVENGIKHGLIDDPNFPLKIRASLIDDVFVFIVHNLKNGHSDQIMDKGNTGIGIKNIIKRLDAVYKSDYYSLDSEDGEEDYIVTFTVDFNLMKK